MHLWPSLRIRDSFKIGYLKKLEWNQHRMNSEKKKPQSNQEKLLENGRDSADSNKNHGCLRFCRELLMFVSCCYCCFCCGACIDQEEENCRNAGGQFVR